MKKIILCLLFSLSSLANIVSIYKTETKSFISYENFINELNDSGYIVLGEFHNFENIQTAQARIIKDKTLSSNSTESVQIMWEFINHTDQESINTKFNAFVNGRTNSVSFVSEIAGKQNISYAPIMEVAKEFNSAPIALNLPRELKKKVMEGGILAIDPKYIPAHHYVGGDQYRERFSNAMGGHMPPQSFEKYFLAQCLTDSVMSDIANKNELNLNFIIAGSFHTDFFDGTVSRLKEINSSKVTTLKITNNELFDSEFITGSEDFGSYADYIVITE
ncbi:ChaN family lipoprotein [Halobacteriovorax sp. JY17]|uniref:ChaN family lipoprotein n=1 Tax=Halobacteriovorax sp. JY17 TaxID=2014617 RepID=UPI0025C03158|nr:ChaN family lipoprotein [Halobacteriovorax sp. JY17]